MKSKTKKRLIAFMLCMVLVLSSTISAFADELQDTDSQNQIETMADPAAEEAVADEPMAESLDASPEEQQPVAEQPVEEPVQEEVQTPEETPVVETPTEPAVENTAPIENEEIKTEEPAVNETQPILQLTYEDDNVKVTVDAVDAGNIPDGASLSVTPIIKKEITDSMSDEEKEEAKAMNDQYDHTEKKLQEKAKDEPYDIAGFLAYDITFVDANGNKLEPNGDVKISMEYKKAEIPEEAKKVQEEKKDEQELDVTVMHLEEDEQGEVKEVVDMVADENETATVEITDSKEVKKAEFVTNSFSVFTLTWNKQNGLKIQVVDENGHSIGSDTTYSLSSETLVTNLAKNITGLDKYDFQRATIKSTTGTEIKRIRRNNNKWEYNTSENSNKANWSSINNDDVYFIYKLKSSAIGLHIVDDIINSGALKLEYTSADGATTTITSCTWLRSDSKTGEYTPVEKVNYQASATLIKSNLSDDGKELYPAYDNGARKWYKARVTIADGTTVESEPFQVTYYNELQNGSFEVPAYNTMMSQVSNSSYASDGGVWQTTGTGKAPDDTGKDIEILRNDIALKDNYAWNKTKYDDGHDALNAAYDQQQFAELNCQTAGALYQDVLTQEGTSLNYWLAHRARGDNKRDWKQGYDTMFLVIMPTQTAINNNLTTQTNLQNYLNTLGVNYNATDQTETSEQVYNTNGVMVLRITSSNAKWHFLSQTNGYTPASSLTRFFFMAGKTASTSKKPSADTIGNFLDNVGFSQQLPPVADDEFTLQVKKEFNGLNSDEITQVKDNLEFTISAKKDGTELTEEQTTNLFGLNKISGKDMTSLADGSLVYTLSNKKIKTGNQYEVTITEENADLSGYNLDFTATTNVAEKDKEAVESPGSVITNLTGKMTATVSFKNTYKSANYKKVNFKKIWDDDNNSFKTRPASLTVTLHAAIVVEEDGMTVEKTLTDLEQTAELNDKNNWECSWNTPVYYDYNGTKVKIQYKVTEGIINSDYVYTSSSNGTSISGDGSNYTYTDFTSIKDIGNDSTSSQKLKKTLSANALSLFANTALQSANEDSGLGVPAHNKYINYNPTTSDYTLNLDVTGAKGNASGVDVLFVIDTSGSMGTGKGSTYTNLLPTVKSLLTGTNGIIDKILPDGNAVNSIAYVSFAGKDETKTSSWYTSNTKANLKQNINSLRATGGTNWTYAMKKASEVLNQKSNSTNEKVVIFLSDGQPTYSLDSYGRQTGNGSQTVSSYFKDAADQVTGSLATAKFYSVYLTTGTKDGMNSFSKKLTNSELVDGTDLTAALTEILNKVIPTYKDVTITDVLSEYVDFVEESPIITVTKKSASETTTLKEGTDFTSSVSGRTVTVNLLNGNSLEEGATYIVSFKVKPSVAANAYYAENGSYPHTGDAGTGSTSAGQDGFYSNDNTNTKLTYSIDGTDETTKTASYPKPVVQVTNHKLTYEKDWNKPDNISEPAENVTLHVTYTDGTTNTITLTKSSHYRAEELVPVTKNIASIIEDPIDGYTPSYEISDNGTKATITNSYSKITSKSITVRKIWNGNGPTTAIKVSLYQSSDNSSEPTLYETAILNDTNNWTYTWNDLPQSIGSGSNYTTYAYAVREENIPTNYTSNITYTDYTAEHTDVTITNTYDPNCADESYYIVNVLQTEHLTINKIWDDADNILNQRPDSLTVKVNDESFNLTKLKNWQTDVTIPKKLHRDYTATETLDDDSVYEQVGSALINSTTTGTSITFINKLKTTSLTVQKVWNDGDPYDRPDTIEFELLYKRKNSNENFQPYGDSPYTLTEEDTNLNGTVSWTKVFENLPTIYDYQVVEKTGTSSNYLSEVTSSENGYIITNTLKWSAIKTSKNWGDTNESIVNLQGAEFQLKSGNTVIATGLSGEHGKINWTVSNESVNLYKLNGDYIIHETKAPTGYMLHDSDWTLTFENGLLTKLNGNSVSGTADTGVVITLTNRKIYSLPSTGGSGIYLYMISGILLMFAAAWILYKTKCREVLKR